MHLVDDENRETRRKPVSIPIHVEVAEDHAARWDDHGWLLDISRSGAGFRLPRPVEHGRLILVSGRIPKEFRLFDFNRPDYKVWAVVRRCIQATDRSVGTYFSIGVAFIGKNPPKDHLRDPSALYQLSDRRPGDDGFWELLGVEGPAAEAVAPSVEKRRHTRLQMAEPVVLQLIDSGGSASKPETTVTENVSRHGAAVFSQLGGTVGSFVRVTVVRHDVTLLAIVRNKHLGPDAMPRLHLEFIDNVFPLDGIE
jgi:hypothetical protein